jgi:hypothetical protein
MQPAACPAGARTSCANPLGALSAPLKPAVAPCTSTDDAGKRDTDVREGMGSALALRYMSRRFTRAVLFLFLPSARTRCIALLHPQARD